MKIKFEITDELVHKFNILMQNELGLPIRKVYINDIGSQYQFEFCDNKDGGRWHFELDKFDKNTGMFTLKCSTRMLEVPLNQVKDLKLFCAKIAQIKQMQTEYVQNR